MNTPWQTLCALPMPSPPRDWLGSLLTREADCAYLRRCGSPRTQAEFRAQVPVVRYEDIAGDLEQQKLAPDVLFRGRPVSWERTGGSSGGAKTLPYSAAGLRDFRRNLLPWLARTARRYALSGRAWFVTSPATRPQQTVGDAPLGLPDAAYLGRAAGRLLAQVAAVPPAVSQLADIAHWRAAVCQHLADTPDLELISVWSPTLLLDLLETLPDSALPRLKVISCWADGPSRCYAEALARRLPQAVIQPKGLLSTEGVVSVPDAEDQPVLAYHGFYEFQCGNALLLAEELTPGMTGEVILTTASGLYRYRTGDQIVCTGHNRQGRPILRFVGRRHGCDLVGEKLSESFVQTALQQSGIADSARFALLIADFAAPGYVLVVDTPLQADRLAALEARLTANPQYAHARQLGQLQPLRQLWQPLARQIHLREMLARGVRLGDIKPVALRAETGWLALFAKEVA